MSTISRLAESKLLLALIIIVTVTAESVVTVIHISKNHETTINGTLSSFALIIEELFNAKNDLYYSAGVHSMSDTFSLPSVSELLHRSSGASTVVRAKSSFHGHLCTFCTVLYIMFGRKHSRIKRDRQTRR